jgi:homocitrate synthase NifV
VPARVGSVRSVSSKSSKGVIALIDNSPVRGVLVEDTTLREGEQSPGVAFSPAEKLTIARLLAGIGIQAIEVGTPAMGGPEAEAIKALVAADLPLRLIGWNRGRRSDLEASFACGVDSVHIGLPSSDHHIEQKFKKTRAWVVETMQELVAFAKERGAWVSVSAEDVGRADVEFLVDYAKAAAAAGADRLRMSDTIGILNPFSARDLFAAVATNAGLPLQAHMHNDYGLATANTLAAVRGGAEHVHVTVNGLGERAGIAPIDEVVLGLARHENIDLPLATEGLLELSTYVAHASGRPIPANKPITGGSVFEHESGIHVDGVLAAPDAFEAFEPEAVGAERMIVIGKHSGSRAIQHVLAKAGIDVPRDDLALVVERVRYEATEKKRGLTAEEVLVLYRGVAAAGA